MRNNLFFYSKILLVSLLLSCSAAKTEEDAELQDTIAAAMISAQVTDNEADNEENDVQIDAQQNFAEQQEDDAQQDTYQQDEDNEVMTEAQNNAELDEFDEIAGQQNVDAFDAGQEAIDQQEEGFGEQFEQSDEQLLLDEDEQLQNETMNDQGLRENGEDSSDNSVAISDATYANATVASQKSDEAMQGIVHWIGYVYKNEESLVNVEIVTKNNPQFDIYQEVNRAKQKEIVVRYYNTKLRPKMRRAIDASEFRSPVAYIRTRDGDEDGVVEVVLTIRDEVETKYLAKDGSLLLSFPIPKRYFGDDKVVAEPAEQAVDLSSPLIVVKMDDSKDPRLGRVLGYVFNREVFKNTDPDSMQELPDDSLSFNNTTTELDTNAVPDSDLMMNNSDDNEQQDNFEEDQQQNFQQNNEDNFEENQQQNFQQNFQQNLQQDSEDNFEEDQQQNLQQNFQQNNEDNFDEQENSAARMQILEQLVSSEVIFMHVGQDPADNFSVPDDLSDGSEGTEAPPLADADAAMQQADNTANNAVTNNSADAANPMEDATELDMGQINNSNINNNAELGEALLDEDSLLAPLHGTEAIGQDGAAEDIAVSEAKAVRMVFRDAPLSEVLHAVRTETGTNFIFPPGIGSRKIFLNLSNVPWDEALRALLEINNLAMVKISDNLVRIDTLAAIESYKKQMQSLKIQEGRSRPTKVMILKLSHAKAGVMQGMIRNLLAKVIQEDERIRVEVDERTNSLLIEALPEDLAKIRVLVDRLDYRAPQVKIASRVVEVLTNNSKSFGISWSGPINYDQSRGLGFGSLIFPNFATANFAIDGGGGTGTAGGQGGSFGVHFGSLNDSVALDLRLSMLENQGVTEILQTNNVVVQDGESATITSGTSVHVSVGGGEQGTSLQSVPYNLSLTATPHVAADNSVDMEVNITSDSPRDSGGIVPDTTTRTITTKLLKQSGETIAIGGLYTLEKGKGSFGVPILSSIPILGALFRSWQKREDRRELLFLVTPTILHSGKAGGDDDFGEQGNFGSNLSNNMQQENQFQQGNQFQQDQNFDVDNINSENPSNAEWQANNNQFQQQQGQQGNQQNFDQNNEQLNDEQLNDEQFNDEGNQEDENFQDSDEEINLNEQQNDDEQEQNALTINQQQDLGDQF